MKILINFTILFLVSSLSFAGGSGGGGVRPESILTPTLVDAIKDGGWVGPRPDDSQSLENCDYVQNLGADQDGNVIFNYKAYDKSKVETQAVNPSVLNDVYKKALSDSASSKSWIAVKAQ